MESNSKTFISTGGIANINRPKCKKIHPIPIEKIGRRHLVKVKCGCRHHFVAEIELRSRFRKKVDLPGFCFVTEKVNPEIREDGANVNWESVTIDRKIPNCSIIDISRSGIGFILTDEMPPLDRGDLVRLEFKLDNEAKTEIRQECRIVHTRGNFVGCKMNRENPKLGFYLMG